MFKHIRNNELGSLEKNSVSSINYNDDFNSLEKISDSIICFDELSKC